eukprot:scaffold57994_cov35-Tisochrysis_lutea.AAC.1
MSGTAMLLLLDFFPASSGPPSNTSSLGPRAIDKHLHRVSAEGREDPPTDQMANANHQTLSHMHRSAGMCGQQQRSGARSHPPSARYAVVMWLKKINDHFEDPLRNYR